MTRINVIPPAELCDQHLLAEYRELTRIPNRVKRRIEEGKIEPPSHQPERYVLGEGHVLFFYDKLKFLRRRYLELGAECAARGFKTTPRWPAMTYHPEVWKDYEPDLAARTLTESGSLSDTTQWCDSPSGRRTTTIPRS